MSVFVQFSLPGCLDLLCSSLLPGGFVFSGVPVNFVAAMRTRPSMVKTPLSYMLCHFQVFCKVDCGVKMSSGMLHTVCELEWPTFDVGCPDLVSFNPEATQTLVGGHRGL